MVCIRVRTGEDEVGGGKRRIGGGGKRKRTDFRSGWRIYVEEREVGKGVYRGSAGGLHAAGNYSSMTDVTVLRLPWPPKLLSRPRP